MNHRTALLVVLACLAPAARGIETENLGLSILPAPAKPVVDGKFDDWDLSGGVFACGDVENASKRFAVWFHAMYDAENLYLLARWVDPTPMNHAGSIKGDYGFNGDCLQVRIVTAPDVSAPEVGRRGQKDDDAPLVRTAHVTAWRDRDKLDTIDVEFGRRFNEGKVKDAKTQGARQAFLEYADHTGYAQEIALPWKLLTKAGVEMKPGGQILLTIEPNFTVGTGGRLTIKDVFKSGVPIDRVFTFQGNQCWGYATLEPKGKLPPRPVRLSDGRTFAVRMDESGLPAVDWTGLTKSRLPDGFKSIKFALPYDANVSLNVFAADGTVARQLLANQFLTKGEHEVKWDGLTTPSVRRPGQSLPPGEYTWDGFYHTGIGLSLRGWAGNSGSAPWRGFGADHGNPTAAAASPTGDKAYLGWSGGEGDKPLQCVDPKGNVVWKNIRGGIASAGPIATDGKTVYAFNDVAGYASRAIYRVDAATGRYTEWSNFKSTDLMLKDLFDGGGDAKDAPERPTGLAAAPGRLFVTVRPKNAVIVVDAKTGGVVRRLTVDKVGAIAAVSPAEVLVTSDAAILRVDAESGDVRQTIRPELAEKDWVSALAVDKGGNVYAAIRGPSNQVQVFGPDGRLARTIGRKGGRALVGAWTPDGMLNPAGVAVDGQGQLWVAEDDTHPKRVSQWDAQTGAFKAEFFGASSYGATGAAINPVDPYLIVGQGCEWRIDPRTGRSTCLGVVTREGMGSSRFGLSPDGKRVYLVTTPQFLHGDFPIRIYERLGDANYKLRATLVQARRGKQSAVTVWADANDDAAEQPDEVKTYDVDLGGWFAGWYLSASPDLSLYGSLYQVKVTGWTACGAPQYDLGRAVRLPAPPDVKVRGGMGAQRGQGSADGRLMLWNAAYGEDHSTVDCFDIASGKRLWTYPSNFVGVHGSHRAVGPEVGMIRGAYDVAGVFKLPAPVGNCWVIPTNKGEWHVLTERGFYLSKLFEGDPMRTAFPDPAVPGVSLDTCPPGAGEEAFGGSVTQTTDGGVSVQAGHVSYWDAQVTGLDTIKPLPGGKLTLGEDDAKLAADFRQRYLQEATTAKRLTIGRATPAFTGDLDKDFAGAEVAKYQKADATAVRTALAYDDRNLYAVWDVKDNTPWVNGADAPEFMYARGDTVDLQLGADPKAPKDRKEAGAGDLRLSIGAFNGKPTAVVYRRVAAEKSPKFFNSGVTKNYEMQSVVVLKDAKIEVKIDAVNKRYAIEAAVPLAALGLAPAAGVTIRGDVGATHGNAAGNDTVLRTHWSNQNTGLVSDEVFELQMTPAAWGELVFK